MEPIVERGTRGLDKVLTTQTSNATHLLASLTCRPLLADKLSRLGGSKKVSCVLFPSDIFTLHVGDTLYYI
jgi:hypothetical protein